jgi:hypothetical protein
MRGVVRRLVVAQAQNDFILVRELLAPTGLASSLAWTQDPEAALDAARRTPVDVLLVCARAAPKNPGGSSSFDARAATACPSR